jgi:lipopolysaccharide transport system ATP-binding protein
MKPAIRVENLSKRYRVVTGPNGGTNTTEMLSRAMKETWRKMKTLADPGVVEEENTFWALKDASFEVQPGEVVGVIGRNGAGKSTLLKILSRIVEPTSGRAEYRGRMGSLLEVGTGFHPELTGRENVYLNGAVLGMSRREIDKKFDEIVAFSEIEKFLDTPVKRYSSGMYVRLAFAVASQLEPEIIVVDEVLAVGDDQFQKKCLGKMEDVAKEGRTVLFVSHNMGAVKLLTTRCICLTEGRVTIDGTPDAAISEYLGQLPIDAEEALDIDYYRRSLPKPDDPVAIRDVYTSTPDANKARIINPGQPITFNIDLDCRRDVAGACVSIAIYSKRQERVVQLYTYDQGVRLGLPKGLRTIRCTPPVLPLAPGEYFVDVGVARATCSLAWDVIFQMPLFKILDTLGHLEWHDRPWGCLHLPDVNWAVSS